MLIPPRPKQVPTRSLPFAWRYRGRAPSVPKPPAPYSHQEILRRRAELATQAYLRSQTNSFLDPGLNPNVANRIQREYGLLDDSDLRAAAQVVGGTAGAIKGGLAGAKKGAALGTFAGPKGTIAGGIIGGAIGGISGGFVGASIGGTLTPSGMMGTFDLTRDLIIDTIKNPIGGSMQASQIVGNTMGQLKGSPVFKSAILQLQDDGDMMDNLRRAYGHHEDGFSRLDFSRIRKNANIDLPFGNAVVDFIGEMAMDPINWEKGVKRKITATVTDGSAVILSAESQSDPLLQVMGISDFKKIGELTLDSTVDPEGATQQFVNMVRSNPEMRKAAQELAGQGPEALKSYLRAHFKHYSDLIQTTITKEQADYFTQISRNVDQSTQNLEQLKMLTGNSDLQYEHLGDNISAQFRRKGFNFRPIHLEMLQNQYPALRRSSEITDLQNKWLMRVANPGYSVGTEGTKKLIKFIKEGNLRESLVKHFGTFNQGRTPFIDIKDQGEILSITPTKRYSEIKRLAQDQTFTSQDEKEVYRTLFAEDDFKYLDQQSKELKEQLDDVYRRKTKRMNKLRERKEELQKKLNVHSGDDVVNEHNIKHYKKQLQELQKQKEKLNPQQMKIKEKYTDLINTYNQMQGYLKMSTEKREVYSHLQGLLDEVEVFTNRFKRLYKEERLGQDVIERGKTLQSFYISKESTDFIKWLQDNEEYQKVVGKLIKEYDYNYENLINTIGKDNSADELLELDGIKKALINHPAMQLFKKTNETLKKSQKKYLRASTLDAIGEHTKDMSLFDDSLNKQVSRKEPVDFLQKVQKSISEQKYENFEKELKHLGIDTHLAFEIPRRTYDPFVSYEGIGSLDNLFLELDDALRDETKFKIFLEEFEDKLKEQSDYIKSNIKKTSPSPGSIMYAEVLKEQYMRNQLEEMKHLGGAARSSALRNISEIINVPMEEMFEDDMHNALISTYMTLSRGDHLVNIEGQLSELTDYHGYWGNAYNLLDYNLDKDDIEQFFQEVYGTDIETVASKQANYIKLRLENNLTIDGEKIPELKEYKKRHPDEILPEVGFLVRNYHPELWPVYEQIMQDQKTKNRPVFVTMEKLLGLQNQISAHYTTLQINQNYTRLQQLTDHDVRHYIHKLNDMFNHRGDSVGAYKMLGQALNKLDLEELEDTNLAYIKQQISSLNNTSSFLSRLLSKDDIREKMMKPYSATDKNTFTGPFFDMMNDLNNSRLITGTVFDDGKNHTKSTPKYALRKLKNLRASWEKREFPEEVIDVVMEEAHMRIKDLELNGENSKFYTDDFFTELNSHLIDDITNSLDDMYSILYEQAENEKQLGRSQLISEVGLDPSVYDSAQYFREEGPDISNMFDDFVAESLNTYEGTITPFMGEVSINSLKRGLEQSRNIGKMSPRLRNIFHDFKTDTLINLKEQMNAQIDIPDEIRNDKVMGKMLNNLEKFYGRKLKYEELDLFAQLFRYGEVEGFQTQFDTYRELFLKYNKLHGTEYEFPFKEAHDFVGLSKLHKHFRKRDIDSMGMSRTAAGSAMDFESAEMPTHPPFLTDFKHEIRDMRTAFRAPLKETKAINENLKNHMLTPSGVQQKINIDKPFNLGELVRDNAPFTAVQPKHTRYIADAKRDVKSWVGNNKDSFKTDLTLREIHERTPFNSTEKAFQSFDEMLQRMKDDPEVRSSINKELMGGTKTPIKDVIWNVFDVETTSTQRAPKELDVIQWSFRNEDMTYENLVADQTISKAIQNLTGISQAQIDAEGVPQGQITNEIKEFMKKQVGNKGLVAHNLDFDLARLNMVMDTEGYSHFDTLTVARALYEDNLERFTLRSTFEYLENKIRENADKQTINFLNKLEAGEIDYHDASTDTQITMYVFKEMLKELDQQGIKHVEELDIDYTLQRASRKAMFGESISTTYSSDGIPLMGSMHEVELKEKQMINRRLMDQLEPTSNKFKKFKKAEKEISDELLEIKQAGANAQSWNYLEAPSLMDMTIHSAISEVVGKDNFYEFTDVKKEFDNIGINSTKAKYALMYYDEHLKSGEIENKLRQMKQELEPYQSYEMDDLRKYYGQYIYKKWEPPETEALTGLDYIKEKHQRLSTLKENHRAIKQEIDEVNKYIGGYDREDKQIGGAIRDLLLRIPEGEMSDQYIKDYLESLYSSENIKTWDTIDPSTINNLVEEIKTYRKENPDNMDWTHPLIRKLRGYAGEIGDPIDKTQTIVRLEHLQSRYDAMLKGKHLDDKKVAKIKEITTEYRKQLKENPDSYKALQKDYMNKMASFYSEHELETMQEILEEINELRLNKDTSEMTVDFEETFIPGNVKDRPAYQTDAAYYDAQARRVKKKLDKVNEEYRQLNERRREGIKEKFGGYNSSHAYQTSKEFTDALIERDYETFRKDVKENLPDITDQEIDEIIEKFEENVLRKQKGKNLMYYRGERVRVSALKDPEYETGHPYYTDKQNQIQVDFDDPMNMLSPLDIRYDQIQKAESVRGELEELLINRQKSEDPDAVEWVMGAQQKRELKERPRVNKLERLERFYNMDLQDIQGSFTDGRDLQGFLEDHPEYKLVATVHDDSEAARSPSQWYTGTDMDTGEAVTKRKTAYRDQLLSQGAKIDKEFFEQGEYDTDKPAIKELLFKNADELDDLFTHYDPSEVSVGIMSIDDFKAAKEISYKPYELPGPLDWFYKNIVRLQKQDMLVNSSWQPTNFVDIGRKNSQMMEGIWEAEDFADKTLEAGDLYFTWNEYRKEMLTYLKQQDKLITEDMDPKEIYKIKKQLNELGSLEFHEYLEKRGFAKPITSLDDINLQDTNQLGTQVYRKLKNSKSFERLSEDEKVLKINDGIKDRAQLLKATDAFQRSSATTDMPQYLQKMDQKKLDEDTTLHTNVFRWLSAENPIVKTNMKAATSLEQTGRLQGYLLDRHLHGTSHDAALMRSLKRHFDYSDKSLQEKYLTLVFPFIAFPTRNALFWQEQLHDAALNRRYYHFINAAWGRFDMETNEYAQAMRSKGYIPIGNTLVKVGDSRASALNMGTNFGDAAMSRLNPLLRAPIEALRGETDKTAGRQIAEALPVIRRIPQMSDQIKNIQDKGLSHKTAFPGVFGTIYDDSDHRRPVFRTHQNTYQNLYNTQGQLRQLSNNAYYRVRQIQNEQHRRRRS